MYECYLYESIWNSIFLFFIWKCMKLYFHLQMHEDMYEILYEQLYEILDEMIWTFFFFWRNV